MSKHWKYLLSAGALLAALTFAPGLPALAATPADTLVVAKQIDDIISLDPAEAYELSGIEMITNIYDRIMRFEADDVTKLVGGAAESWTISADGKTFTFKLRAGHDVPVRRSRHRRGRRLLAAARRQARQERRPSSSTSSAGPRTTSTRWSRRSIPSTLQMTIDADFSPSLVLSLLSSVVGSVVDKKVALAHETNGDLGNGWLKTNSAGSGAVRRFNSWKANESVVMEAFPGYRGGAPTIKRVVVRHVPEPATQRLLIESGDVDIAENLTPDQIAGLAGDKDVRSRPSPQATLIYVGLNLKTKELADNRVRQALKDLVDYDGMANSFLKGQFTVHQTILAVGLLGLARQERIFLRSRQGQGNCSPTPAIPTASTSRSIRRNSSPYMNIAQSIQSTMAQGGHQGDARSPPSRSRF